MKLLFLTTFDVSLEREHVFTINVWKELSKLPYSNLASIEFSREHINTELVTEVRNGRSYYRLKIPSEKCRDVSYLTEALADLFNYIRPSVVHSNMIEGYDIIAAKRLNIPIVLTIHIGGFICPRGGGNGFLMYNDSICNQKIGKRCMKCGCMDLPFPHLSYLLLKIIPKNFITYIANKIRKKNILYITPFVSKYTHIQNRKDFIQLLDYAHIIVANDRLAYLLEINGVHTRNIHLIPHGVKERKRLPFPDYDGKIKFFYLGRIQYSKGLHVLMKAFMGIDVNKYELHIIGDAERAGHGFEYQKKIEKLAKSINVTFHGRIPNENIEEVIKGCHIMVHSAIFLEVYGISIAESLSMGRPVLATRCGGAEMQVKDGYNGWLISPNSVSEMHDKILYIIQHFSEVRTCAEHSKLPHSIENYSLNLQSLYRQIKK